MSDWVKKAEKHMETANHYMDLCKRYTRAADLALKRGDTSSAIRYKNMADEYLANANKRTEFAKMLIRKAKATI